MNEFHRESPCRWPCRPVVVPAACILLALCATAPLAAAGHGAGDVLRVGPVSWKGYPDGLQKPYDPRAFVLSPDAGGLLYYQGRPLERLMYLRFKTPDAPVMVGALTPFGQRRPCFSPAGDFIYFTARAGASAFGPRSEVFLRSCVVRVDVATRRSEFLHPSRGAAGNTHAVFLDIHPSGTVVLIGVAHNVPAADALSPDTILEVEELRLPGGPARSPPRRVNLGLRVAATAAIRYTRRGEAIVYAAPRPSSAGDVYPAVYRFDRKTRTSGLLRPEGSQQETHAGDFSIASFLVPHLGSFGWDGFVTYVARNPETPSAPCRPVVFSRDVLAASGIPPRPVSLRPGVALVCGGRTDEPLPIVAAWRKAPGTLQTAALPAEGSAASQAAAALRFDPRMLGGAILARRSLDVEPILLALARSLGAPWRTGASGMGGGAAATRPTLRATLREWGPRAPAEGMRVEVVEQSPGRLRVKRFFPGQPETEEGTAPGDSFHSEIVVFDGETCSLRTTGGESVRISPQVFAREVNRYSPFRLFWDPARLGDARVRFESAAAMPATGGEPSGRRRVKLEFAYADGYRGELIVEEDGSRVLPVEVRTRLVLATRGLEHAAGLVPRFKTASFADWRAEEGRLVPHRIEFDDGLRLRRIELRKLVREEDTQAALLEKPDR